MAVPRPPSPALRPGIWALPRFPFPPPFPFAPPPFQFVGGNSGFFHLPRVSQTLASSSTDVPSASMNSSLDSNDRQWVRQWLESKAKKPQSRAVAERKDQETKVCSRI